MPRYIIKPKRDEDFYVEWSTVVDDWTWAGTRAEAEQEFGSDRIQRADDTGTSEMWYPTSWETAQSEFTLGQHPAPGHFGSVKRDQLREYINTQYNDGDFIPLGDPRLEKYITLTPFED